MGEKKRRAFAIAKSYHHQYSSTPTCCNNNLCKEHAPQYGDLLGYADLQNFLGAEGIHVIGDTPPGSSCILNTDEFVWATVAIASNSGCVRHAAQKNLLHTQVQHSNVQHSSVCSLRGKKKPTSTSGAKHDASLTRAGRDWIMFFDNGCAAQT